MGNNLASDASCALSAAGDLENTNPLLGALAANGGPTETHGLLAGSPAIDAANPTGAPATDQRGVARPVGTGFDIGAFEGTVGGGPTPTLSIDSVTADEGDAGTTTFDFHGDAVRREHPGGHRRFRHRRWDRHRGKRLHRGQRHTHVRTRRRDAAGGRFRPRGHRDRGRRDVLRRPLESDQRDDRRRRRASGRSPTTTPGAVAADPDPVDVGAAPSGATARGLAATRIRALHRR